MACLQHWRLILVTPIAAALSYAATAQAPGPQEFAGPPTSRAGQSAPPRTIQDITALLDQYKPDPKRAEAARAKASEQPPVAADAAALALFYRERSRAAHQIGLVDQRIADLRMARGYARESGEAGFGLRADLFEAERDGGNFLNAVRLREDITRQLPKNKEMRNFAQVASAYAELAEVQTARHYLAEADAIAGTPAKQRRRKPRLGEHQQAAYLERARGDVFRMEGKLAEATEAYRRAIAEAEADLAYVSARIARGGATFVERHEALPDDIGLRLADVLIQQGKPLEAEARLRGVLERTLRRIGRDSVDAGKAITMLAAALFEQGRYADAEKLVRAAIESFVHAGAAQISIHLAAARKALGTALVAQGKWQEALAVYARNREAFKRRDFLAERFAGGDVDWALALVKTGQAAQAVSMLEARLARLRETRGATDPQMFEAQGFLGMALAAAGQREGALDAFRAAIPALLEHAHSETYAEGGGAVRIMRLRHVLESYLDLLATRIQEGAAAGDAVNEAYRVAEVSRASSVQRALAASAARGATGDARLAGLARREQDAAQRIGVLAGLLSQLLEAPPDQQLPEVAAGVRAEIESLRAERMRLRREIARAFPEYAELVDPKPPSVGDTQAALAPGEALIAILVGADRTYVWAVLKQGRVSFAVVPFREHELREVVARLRRGLDTGETELRRLPPFDVAEAHRLFSRLLEPVAEGWKSAASLLIVPSGAVAQIPFALLPTAAVVPATDGLLFSGYKQVPWLIRRAAITQVPSVNAFTVLRRMPPAARERRPFVGFGDPYFSREQAADAQMGQGTVQAASVSLQQRNAVRGKDSTGKPVQSLRLGDLPRLPDTAEEVRDIARLLRADAKRDVFIGAAANERNVMKANLADVRVIAFATHGLVPGDLDGLDQPALALAAPEVAGVEGDGLLTLDEILGLKLGADWVVLSACNSAAGEGQGAEAISGLGRGFFYAGSRALLVTHWPVETRSARQLVTRLFERYAADPNVTRAEALRQASLNLIDGPGATDAGGKPLYSYAHPLFWAPYALVGDGGR